MKMDSTPTLGKIFSVFSFFWHWVTNENRFCGNSLNDSRYQQNIRSNLFLNMAIARGFLYFSFFQKKFLSFVFLLSLAQRLERFWEKSTEHRRIVGWIFLFLCRKVQLFKRCRNYKTDGSLIEISEIMDSISNCNWR